MIEMRWAVRENSDGEYLVLQYRQRYRSDKWTEWTDVPIEEENETT